MIAWHRLLGLTLSDFFKGSGYEVETEVDTSIKKQLLDIVVIRKTASESMPTLPTGLEPLQQHT